ncbi:MAG: prepilin-type N-terminal cleavage/methylation domain-containing protein [Candidatus Hinthialibacter antarcticus]|nr:prepilin-type N-terminal cleavage/methylation domain-containing protein [Candidatus Hinthialibacter antarcticus]
MNMKTTNAGFTLIELVVAISLVLLITAVGAPSFRQLYERSELQRASGEFTNTLRYAQQRAVLERTPIRVVLDVDENKFWVPVEQQEERRHYRSKSRRNNSRRRSSTRSSRDRVREEKATEAKLPEGFIFEFVYKVSEDDEVKRGEGEIYFYPDGSADASYVTLLRLGNHREDEQRVFIKLDPVTGAIRTHSGYTEQDGSAFYQGEYDGPYL